MYDLVDVLAQTNKFRVEDLQVNHQGRLSGAQKSRLLRRILKPVILFVLIALVFIALFVALVAVDEDGYYLKNVLSQLGWRITLIALIVPILIIAFLWRSFKLVLDLREGRVALAEGHVEKVWSSYYKGSAMFYVIGDLKFEVSNQAYNALIEGTTYRVYYTPRSKLLVSVEPTGAWLGGHDDSQEHEKAAAGSPTHAGQLLMQVPHNRNPYNRRGLAWYFGLMVLSLLIGLVFYFLSPAPSTNAKHRSSDDTSHTRNGTEQK